MSSRHHTRARRRRGSTEPGTIRTATTALLGVVTPRCGYPAPMRIASLLPAATDIVAVLGAGADLVGRTHECDWPPAVVRDLPVVTATALPAGLAAGRSRPPWAGPGTAGRRSTNST